MPNDGLAEEVADATGTALPLTGGNVLNQLLAYGVSDLDDILTVPSSAKGDWTYFASGAATDPLMVSPELSGRLIVAQHDTSVKVVTIDSSAGKTLISALSSGVTIPAVRK